MVFCEVGNGQTRASFIVIRRCPGTRGYVTSEELEVDSGRSQREERNMGVGAYNDGSGGPNYKFSHTSPVYGCK